MSKFTRVTEGKFVRVAQVDYLAQQEQVVQQQEQAAQKLIKEIQEAMAFARNPDAFPPVVIQGKYVPIEQVMGKKWSDVMRKAESFNGTTSQKAITNALGALKKQMDYPRQEVPKEVVNPAKTPSAPVAAPAAQTAPAPASTVGKSPVDQATPTSSSTPVAVQTSVASATTVAPAVAKPNYFALAGLDPNGKGYVGKADQNEKLRRAIDSVQKTQSRTFYDAYSKAFGGWNQHPSNRIDNLIGKTAPTAKTPAPEKVAPTQDPPAPKQTATPTTPTPAAQSVAANPSTPPSPSYGGGYSPSRIP